MRRKRATAPCFHGNAQARHIGYYADGSDTTECDRDGKLTGHWLCKFEIRCGCGERMYTILRLPQPVQGPAN